jgi:hypothetical protein
MKQGNVLASVAVLLAGAAWAGESSGPARPATTPEALKAQIEGLKPARHAWRAIAWKTCPLEALKESRRQKKPVLAWVFLGIPTDERC